MIKKIIQCADLHIRPYQRLEEYGEQLSLFVDKCKEEVSQYKKSECRIIICGDITHSKISISNELIVFVCSFLRELEKICKVIVYSGNHDLISDNKGRTDTITAIFEAAHFENCIFLDEMLDYESGCVVDDNVIWALYSIFSDYSRPNIEGARMENEGKKVIGLYHGTIVGSSLDNGIVVDKGLSLDAFDGCDCVMCGDIHKRQTMRYNGFDVVYSGSLIQQTFGESVTQHGYCVWDMEDMSHKFIDVESDYGLYDVEINSIDDIDNDLERLKNL